MTPSFTKTLLFSVCCAGGVVATAQTADTARRARVEKYIWGARVGILNVWGYYERRLTDRVALRTELGTYFAPIPFGKSVFVLFFPAVTVESRRYYNLSRRMRASRDITHNSGNFIALKMGYIRGFPHFFVLPFILRMDVIPMVFTWGIRRNLGHRFNYELGVQAGVLKYLNVYNYYLDDLPMIFPFLFLHLRIGYRFLGSKK